MSAAQMAIDLQRNSMRTKINMQGNRTAYTAHASMQSAFFSTSFFFFAGLEALCRSHVHSIATHSECPLLLAGKWEEKHVVA